MHPGQFTLSAETVRDLVSEQFPEWSSLAVRAVSSDGTVNALFRIGDDLVARFPLVPDQVETVRRRLESEARAARQLCGLTRFPTPRPIALGEPGAGYPLPWSVQTWLPGAVATAFDPGDSEAFAQDLAAFISDIRSIDTAGETFESLKRTNRGGHLPDHDKWVETCLMRSAQLLDVPPLRALWTRLRTLPPTPGGDMVTHGDLTPGNVLVTEDARLAAVIDVGGLGPADPALDLVAVWHLLDPGPREVLRAELGCSDLEWTRGVAWAFEQALGLVWYYADSNPTMCAVGRRTIARITDDWCPTEAAETVWSWIHESTHEVDHAAGCA